MFYGDSRAADWPGPERKGLVYANRGIHGQTSKQILDRYPFDVAPQPMDVLVIQAGVNDLKAIPLFPERREEIVASCIENLKALVALGEQDAKSVILTTVMPVGPPSLAYRPVWSDEVAAAVKEVKEALLKAFPSPGKVQVLNTNMLADEQGVLHKDFRLDHLHLNGLGYDRLNLQLMGTS